VIAYPHHVICSNIAVVGCDVHVAVYSLADVHVAVYSLEYGNSTVVTQVLGLCDLFAPAKGRQNSGYSGAKSLSPASAVGPPHLVIVTVAAASVEDTQ
jgi:hypothetical protein